MVTEEEIKKMSPEQIAELQKQQCPFCKIVSGEIPAKKIYEDNLIIAIMDINPAKKGHVILLTKEHRMMMPHLTKEEIANLAIATKKISNGILKGLKAKGTTIVIANGPAAGQKGPHFLQHIIPRDETELFKYEKMNIPKEDRDKLVTALK